MLLTGSSPKFLSTKFWFSVEPWATSPKSNVASGGGSTPSIRRSPLMPWQVRLVSNEPLFHELLVAVAIALYVVRACGVHTMSTEPIVPTGIGVNGNVVPGANE